MSEKVTQPLGRSVDGVMLLPGSESQKYIIDRANGHRNDRDTVRLRTNPEGDTVMGAQVQMGSSSLRFQVDLRVPGFPVPPTVERTNPEQVHPARQLADRLFALADDLAEVHVDPTPITLTDSE